MEVAAAWAEVRVGVRKRDNIKSIYMVLEVAVALAEARVGVKRSDNTRSVSMGLDESGSGIRRF